MKETKISSVILRWKLSNRGKKGGIRTLYVDFVFYGRIYLITAYTKNVKDNISPEEKREIKKLINLLEKELEELER